MRPEGPKRAGIYIHVPFCRIRCSYCTFVIHPWREDLAERYRDAVVAEIASSSSSAAVDTIYFGGGTPSLVPVEHLEAMLAACRSAFEIEPGCEITLEANPGSISAAAANQYRELGVNRVSLGAQSFDQDELDGVGRDHTAADVEHTVQLLRECGIANCSLDLIPGLPGQTDASWRETLQRACRLAPAHLSLYMLELDARAPLFHAAASGRTPLPDDDRVADRYVQALETLRAHGYEQYEISNFARPGFESRHNMKYWLRAPVLAFGVGSHSFDGSARYANVADLRRYLEALESGESAVEWRRPIDAGEGIEETLFLGLRLRRGIDWGALRSVCQPERKVRYDAALEELRGQGLLEGEEGALRLTRRGMLLSNEVFQAFI
jgi:oxygen-independent coproporphyrinogen-3 oxidase